MADIIHVSQSEYNKSPGGVDCIYIQLGDSGIKAYKNRESRDRSVSNQRRLGAHAPRVIVADVTVVVGGIEYFGMETEHISQTLQSDLAKLNKSDSLARQDLRSLYYDLAHQLAVELSPLGVYWMDNHCGNIGIKDGKTVIIDCADKLFEN